MSEDLANSYAIRPNFKQKFRPVAVKSLIHDVLNEEIGNKKYDAEESKSWSQTITDTLLSKLNELELERYKFVVQVIIGEQRGEGVNVGCRCLWDSDTDNFAQDILMTDLNYSAHNACLHLATWMMQHRNNKIKTCWSIMHAYVSLVYAVEQQLYTMQYGPLNPGMKPRSPPNKGTCTGGSYMSSPF